MPTHMCVAFKFNWRSVSELFGVMFQDYLAYTTSPCADHKTVPRLFNHFIGDEVKVVNLENPFDLGDVTRYSNPGICSEGLFSGI
jgi:hypothetical protein